jgi:Rieske Fe-S protein
VITIVPGIGEAGKSIAYVRTRNPAIDKEAEDQYNRWIALSSRCMHLGCPVRWVDAAQRFICPCHGGVYNLRGQVSGGPPVRPLDRFYTRLNQSTGLVEIGPRYSVNSEFRRFSPRDPGEPLDGVGQYLFPSRWSTPPGPAPGLP